MVALNTVTVTGNLGDDPELRFTAEGTAVANFTIASTPRKYDSTAKTWTDGETLWLRCTVWGQQAENLCESAQKGARVVATGALEQNNWETDEGEKRQSVQMNCTDVGMSLLFATMTVKKNDRKEAAKPAKKTTASRRR
jgi:single-strand DNA-binding protein